MKNCQYLIILTYFLLTSCNQQKVYEKNVEINDGAWRETQVLDFDFTIEDASKEYNVYYNIRYNQEYPNYNLYVKHSLSDTTGNLLHSTLQGMDLFKPTSGVAYGSGFAGNFDYKVLVIPKYRFPHPGKYFVKVRQYMRQNPLTGITAFGIGIEKNLPQ